MKPEGRKEGRGNSPEQTTKKTVERKLQFAGNMLEKSASQINAKEKE